MRYSITSFAAAAAMLAAAPAAAQQAAPPPADAFHSEADAIIVTAPFRRDRVDLLSSVSVLSGVELARDLRSTIGDTIARQPGVSATSFGPGASRPVLRGLQGERVRILTDGIGSIDASNTSVDHAVAIDPLLAERVEILRGPAALLYGSSAIGGVVNIIDRRIPRRVPDEAVHFDARALYGSAADEYAVGGAIDIPLGRFVVHFDGSYRDAGDLRIGGPVLARELQEEARANGADEVADLRDRLPNTASTAHSFAGALAYIGDGGNLGVSVIRLENEYGVPIRYALDGGESEAVKLAIEQTRVDARGAVTPAGGWLREIRARFGYADYSHAEIEVETGETGTVFTNRGFEGRLELEQRARGPWRAVYGAQYSHRDFDVVGDEAFVPPNRTDQLGLFMLHSIEVGALIAEVGGRYENTRIQSLASDFPGGATDFNRGYDTWSATAGASYAVARETRVALNLSRSERAPAAEELLANGPHVGTRAYEIGDPEFGTETSLGAEISLRGESVGFSYGLSAYYTRFEDYIDLFPTGDEEDDLPVFQFFQADAEYYGFEAEARFEFARVGLFGLSVDALADYTRARIERVGPVPRIPPFRVRGGLEASGQGFTARVEAEHSAKQDRLAEFETRTGAFTLVNASIAWKPMGEASATTLSLEAANLFDVSARRHASFLKDYAPLAGRDIRVSARLSF